MLHVSRGRGRGATAFVMDADQHRPENVANAVARPKQQARWVTGHVTVSESDSDTLVMGNRAKSRSRSRQKVASAEASPKQLPIRKVRRRSRLRQTSREPPVNPWTEAHLAPYTPYDSGTLECLRQGATDDERKENCRVMEEKMRLVQYAIDNPEKLPESKELANKRVKWLKKQIAKENKMLASSKERLVKECIKYDKKMERQRTRRYEQVDAEHRKRFPDEEENADAQRRRFERYDRADNDHRLMLTDHRCPGPIQTAAAVAASSSSLAAVAVAASSSSSAAVAVAASLTPQQPTHPPPQHLLRTVGVSITARDKQTLITVGVGIAARDKDESATAVAASSSSCWWSQLDSRWASADSRFLWQLHPEQCTCDMPGHMCDNCCIDAQSRGLSLAQYDSMREEIRMDEDDDQLLRDASDQSVAASIHGRWQEAP